MEKYTFTELIEKYNNDGLKVLSSFEEPAALEEEATPEEFEKELEAAKDKASGKVRNKNISKASVQAVEVQKEEEILERELTSSEKEDKEDTVHSMKKKAGYFKEKYGPDWKKVMYATATRMAKGK